MATDRNTPAGADQTKLFEGIVAALRQHPAYLLIFALILLSYLFCIAVLVRGTEGRAGYLPELSFAGLFVTTMFALITVKSLEGQRTRSSRLQELQSERDAALDEVRDLQAQLARADADDINVDDGEARELLGKIVDNVRGAVSYQHSVFRQEISYGLATYADETGRWADGVLVTDAANYERILQEFYRTAKGSVFATSNEEYMEFWAQPGSQNILKAHKAAFDENHATVTRVFVFSTFSAITAEHLAVMQRHSKAAYIKARVFMADESPAPVAGALIRDFVIIDRDLPTQAIGITSSFDITAMGAKWKVGDDPDIEKAARFIEINSFDLEEVEARMKQ